MLEIAGNCQNIRINSWKLLKMAKKIAEIVWNWSNLRQNVKKMLNTAENCYRLQDFGKNLPNNC